MNPLRADLVPAQGELYEGPYADAAGAFGHGGLGFVEPRGAGDIQVDPGGVVYEFAQEPGGADGSSPTASYVGEVGEGAF